MEKYRNKGGNSGVLAFEIGSDSISVQFKGTTKTYKYSYSGKAGRSHVDAMKSLARNGSGLNRYIDQYVKNKFD